MSTKANYLKIGVFVVAAIVILLAGIIALSAGVLTRETRCWKPTWTSGQGLSVGSPVLYRGADQHRRRSRSCRATIRSRSRTTRAYHKYSRYVLVIMAVDRSISP